MQLEQHSKPQKFLCELGKIVSQAYDHYSKVSILNVSMIKEELSSNSCLTVETIIYIKSDCSHFKLNIITEIFPLPQISEFINKLGKICLSLGKTEF